MKRVMASNQTFDGEKDSRRRGRGGALLAVLVLFAGGCQLIGSRGPVPSPAASSELSLRMPEGRFTGFVEIEGGRVNGELRLTPREGTQFEGFFEAPPDLVAIGRGEMNGSEMELELSYEGACPGRMRLRGTWEPESGEISGVVRARDCTGEAEGTFLFHSG